MARPKSEFPPAAAVRALADEQGRLSVRVTPAARTDKLEIVGGRLVARVRAKPQDGEANKAVLTLLARVLDVAPSRLVLIRGATSREKQIQID